MTALHQAASVPLVEQLRSVPADAVLRINTPNALGVDTCSIPVGCLCHEAAAALQQQPEPVAIWQSCATHDVGGTKWIDCSEENARAAEQYGFPCRVLYNAPPALQEVPDLSEILSGETMIQREEVCAAWCALPDDLRKDDRLTRLYHALGGPHMEDPTEVSQEVPREPVADTRRVAMETVYFRRSPNEPWDSLTVPAGTATQHVREELIESIVSAADGIAASPSTTRQQAGNGCARRQYFYKVDGCTARDARDPSCLCWHDEGAGPLAANMATEIADWRDAPAAPSTTQQQEAGSFQQRVEPWLLACFGEAIAADSIERNHRLLEEALELVQACGCTASEAHQLVDYVYGRPVGEKRQEAGGVMVTLAALCRAQGIDMHAEGERELTRIWTMVEKIRAKQAAKPKHSPLPEAAAPSTPAREEAGVQKACCPPGEPHAFDCPKGLRAVDSQTNPPADGGGE